MSSSAEDTAAAENADNIDYTDNFTMKTELIDLTVIDDSETTAGTENEKLASSSKNGDKSNESEKPSSEINEQSTMQVKIEADTTERKTQTIEHDSLILTADDEMFSVVSNGKDSPQKIQKISDDRKLKRETNNVSNKNDKGNKLKDEQKKLSCKSRSESSSKNVSRSVWVSNILKSSRASDLKQHFSKYGKVSTAKVVTDGTNFYGFLSFETRDDAEKCIKKLDDTTFENRKLKLSFTKPNLVTKDASSDKKCSRSTSERKSKRKSHENDSLTMKCSSNKSNKKLRSPSRREQELERDYLRERREIERLKRRLQEQEEQMRLERRRQRQKEEEQRELEWKLEMQMKKMEMEKEMFEKERKDMIRLEEVRRKIEEERLEIMKERAKIEAQLKDALRNERKSDSKKRNETEKDDDKRRKTNVKSKICDTSCNKNKNLEEHYSYRKEPKSMGDYSRVPPPPPKLSETPKSKNNRNYDTSIHRREEEVKKVERDYRKIETIHRERRPDLEGRRDRFLQRNQLGDGVLSQQEVWKQPFASKSWEVGQHAPSGRYESNYPGAAGYSGSRYDSGYCYQAAPGNLGYPRYQQYSTHLERKY